LAALGGDGSGDGDLGGWAFGGGGSFSGGAIEGGRFGEETLGGRVTEAVVLGRGFTDGNASGSGVLADTSSIGGGFGFDAGTLDHIRSLGARCLASVGDCAS